MMETTKESNGTGASGAVKKAKKPAWWASKAGKRVMAGLGALAALCLVVWFFFFRPFVSTDDARVAMTFVRVAPSGVSGRIIAVNVTEGSQVKAGDVLVELDHRVPQAAFERAKTKFELAERDRNRLQTLVAADSATRQALDTARANAAAAETELRAAEVALENTYLKSPFDGIVVQKPAEVGNILESGQIGVVVADVAHAWISANIEETAVGAVEVGQPVKITVDEGGTLTGKVQEIRAAAASAFALLPSDSGSGNYTKVVQRIPIKVALDPHEGRQLRAGQSVEIKIRVR
jgi:membrane fusion protein (multidrug efflux system)